MQTTISNSLFCRFVSVAIPALLLVLIVYRIRNRIASFDSPRECLGGNSTSISTAPDDDHLTKLFSCLFLCSFALMPLALMPKIALTDQGISQRGGYVFPNTTRVEFADIRIVKIYRPRGSGRGNSKPWPRFECQLHNQNKVTLLMNSLFEQIEPKVFDVVEKRGILIQDFRTISE